jgi:hypothetical protein
MRNERFTVYCYWSDVLVAVVDRFVPREDVFPHGVNEFLVRCDHKGYLIKKYTAYDFLHLFHVTFGIREKLIRVHRIIVTRCALLRYMETMWNFGDN